ncbi:MAG: hypothetical protein ABSC51_08090 [Gaiellaceae bacterium]|jgi:hypothetical protein
MYHFARMFAGSRRRVLSFAALVLALVVAGAAVSASAGARYQGKTKQGSNVAFRTTARKVAGFKTSASTLCVSAASAKSFSDFRLVNLPSTPLKNGHFKITFKIPTISLIITAKGTVRGNSASGKLDVIYNKIRGLTPGGLQDFYAYFTKTTWKAKKV